MSSCLVLDPCIDWDEVKNWSISKLRGKSMQAILCKLCLAAAVYHLWSQQMLCAMGIFLEQKRL
jgi:hypothetical protein